MKKNFVLSLGFNLKDNSNQTYFKKYHDNTIIEVDFEKEIFHFGGKIKIHDKEIQKITKPEDWVVFECVDRLLVKGYKGEDIILENSWKTGHGTSGRIDILVKKDDKSFLMIECKTWGGEFEKEFKNMQKDGGQLFTYFQQDRNAEFLVLYTSNCDGKIVEYKNEIVKVEESYKETSNVPDFYSRWNKFTKQNGIFENWVMPYDFKSKALTKKDLVKIKQVDSSIIFNRFLEILRHNTVSDKPNAFNKMFTLFLCKIHDEGTKGTDDELDFQYKEGIDNDITFQTRLTDLYKRGMMEFLKKEITDFNDDEFNSEFGEIDEKLRIKILEKITKLRLQKNNEFAIKEVFDEETFIDNAKVLKEVVELLQVYQIRYAEKQPFLGDFFELLLTTGLKQESGQFFTPVPIARFICKSIPLNKIIENKLKVGDTTDLLPSTIDYAAGSGHFLTESMEEIQNIVNSIDIDSLKPNVSKEIKKWKGSAFDWALEYMYGIEKDYRLVKTAKVGCYLHGDGIATVIHGDGLDSFQFSKHYRGKLTDFNKEDKQENAKFDLVLSNPPYSVSAFKSNLDRDKSENDFDLYNVLTDKSSEIECLFIERTKQLLKEGGIAAIILPSSILNNSGIYTKAREIILRNFEIISIVSLGSGTFMATGTNTVTLFMRKRNKFFAKNLEASISKFFVNFADISLSNIENVFSKYVNYVWGISFEDYKTLLSKSPNDTIKKHELYLYYIKKNKIENILEIEKEKILYFVLSYNQNLVLVKSGEKQEEKEFLGYEFSNRKGSEGIHSIKGGKLIDDCTKLFDPKKSDNESKVSTYIYDGFNNKFDREVNESLKNHILRAKLVDLLTFDRTEFDKAISTSVKKKIKIESKWEIATVGNVSSIQNGFAFDSGLFSSNEGFPLIRIRNIKTNITETKYTGDFSDDYVVKNDDLIIGMDGEFNHTLWQGGNALLNQRVCKLHSFKGILKKYLFYYIGDSLKYIENETTAITVKHISSGQILAIQIPLPPLDIQTKIVSEIEILEKKENENKEKVESLKNVISEIILNIKGDNKILGDICDVRDGTHDSPKFYGEGYPLITGKNLVNGKIDYSDIKLISKEDYIKINQRSLVEKGDVLFGMIGTIGNPVLVQDEVNFAIKNVALFKFSNNKILLNGYFRHLLDSQIIIEQLENGTKGSTQKFVGLNILRNLRIPIPSLEIQKQIVSQIEKIEKAIEILESELKEIPEKKKEVLKKYL